MNPVTHFSVPLWTLLFFSALLKVVPTQTIDTECNGTEILSTSQMTQITTMTTTFSLFLNISNCTLYIGNPVNGTTTDLIPGAVYPVYLNCTNCSKQLSSLTKNPATVTGLNITEITTSSLSLSWTKPVGNSSFYKVQWTDDIVSGSLNVSATSTTITNLTAGVRYYINVSAVADDKVTEGQPSSVFQYTKPAVVVNLTVSITASSVFLSWTQPVGNTLFYTVQSTDGSLNMNLNTTQTYVNITGLTPGGQYTFTVRAVAGDQETIGEANAVSLYTKPAVVVNLTVTEFTTSSVFLNWTQPVGNVSLYKVQWTDASLNMNLSTTQTYINITGLTAGGQYTFTVRAVAGDNMTQSDVSQIIHYTRPGRIPNASAFPNITSITLNWTSPLGQVFVYKVVLNSSGAQVISYTNNVSVILSNLTADTSYTIKVIAVAGDNQTEGDPYTFNLVTNPDIIVNLTVTDVTTSSVSLSWSTSSGSVTSYIVQWTASTGLSNYTNNTVFTIFGLTPGFQYNITVAAAAVTSTNPGRGTLITTFTRPLKPSAIVSVDQGTDHLNISWTLLSGRVDYYLVNFTEINQKYSNTTSTAVPTVSLTNLYPGRLHVITVTAVAGNYTNTSDVFYLASVPVPPAYIVISRSTNSSLTLQWPTPSLMTDAPNISYYITYQPQGGAIQNISSTVNKTDLSLLSSGTLYYITVATVGPQNLNSAVVNNSNSTLPNPVSNLAASSQSTTSVMLTWSYPVGAQSNYQYLVETYNNAMLVNTTIVSQNSTIVSYLEPGTGYNFSVRTTAGEIKSTNVWTVTIYTMPNAVTNLTVSKVNTSAIQLTWLRQSDYKTSYSYWVTAFDGSLVLQNYSTSTETYTVSILTPGKLYTFSVFTVVQGIKSTGQNISSYTFPNPPGFITVNFQSTTSINFTWSSPAGMASNSYNFSVSTFNGSFQIQNNWFLMDKLQSGSPYNISVVTVAQLGYMSTAVTTQAYTRPYPVSLLQPIQITTNAVTLWWMQSESKSFYSYQVNVTNSSLWQVAFLTTTNTTILVPGLLSGSNYSFTVTTKTADGTLATPVTVSYFTRPDSVVGLVAETLNTTTINLTWMKPLGYKQEYRYLVKTTGCASLNKTLAESGVPITGLTPGQNCTFCVSVKAADGTEGDAQCTSNYTMPETVQPSISSQGSNNSILVSWTQPPGNVESYRVDLNSSGFNSQKSVLKNTSLLFSNLFAGNLYTAMVTTVSGPFYASSGFVTNATFPNPPGPIEILAKTTSSIAIKWGEAPLMTSASFSYQLPNISSQGAEYITTTNTSYAFLPLPSGTTYNISVATVGVMGFVSEMVWSYNITTRPLPVKYVMAYVATENNITLRWTKPDEYKESYTYTLAWPNQSLLTIKDTEFTIAHLDPGRFYNFSVTTVTSDGTQSAPTVNSSCTNASPVINLGCEGPNKTEAKLLVSWEKPKGEFSGFLVKVDANEIVTNNSCFNITMSNLLYYTKYNVSVLTQSCGQSSTPVILSCQTGITNPTIPDNYISLSSVTDIAYNKFSIQIEPNLLNESNGPITHVGVLVTKNAPSNIDLGSFLSITYDQWQKTGDQAYLATVINTKPQSRATTPLTIIVGDMSKWNNYTNGPLEPNTQYRYAIVLFTMLTFDAGIVNERESVVSITQFYTFVTLPQNPVIIGIAAGVTAGIIVALLIIIPIGLIYCKRLSNTKPSEIQIHSLRAKVSVAVRVEDYEAYYTKQKADSNCGFAEEFEDLKPVGTSQTKTNALTLENKPKNRYNNVLPYDSSRVKLSIIHGSPYDDYINANYMPGYNSRKEFIAAQGPLPTTVNEFWRMIWEKNVQTLVMLTRCNEQGRVKCEQYWSSGTKPYGNISVTTTSEIPLEDWTIRDFSIKNVKTAETRSVRHFHFTAWPDHGVPETTELLISFRHLVREHMDQYSKHSPAVVHCSAGVGRTGTFITIDRLIFQIERENIVDVYGIVHDLRMHRTLMVQTEDQYVFLNQCALDIIRSRTGTNVDLIYQNTAALSIYENVNPKKEVLKNGYNNA